jgi:signal transduction histidine kinase
MFNKLRNRLLIFNLVIISVMMLTAFAIIYFITYQNVQNDIEMRLRKISEFDRNPNSSPGQFHNEPGRTEQEPPKNVEPPPDRSISFSLLTDGQGKVTTISSRLDMDSEFYESAKEEAVSQGRESGSFKLNGSSWAFTVKPVSEGYSMAFLDVTSQHGFLTGLIYTFLIAAFVMLVVIFLISRLFANRSIKPVKEAFDKQKQFIADASHELKTPLAVINTNVDVLLSNSEDTISSQSKWLHYIKSESERMSKLTNDLLYLTRMDYSENKMVFSGFDLSKAVENVILTMEAVIFEQSLSLDYDLEPDLKAYGSSEQIQQVVMILLDNAVKYSDRNGSIQVSLKRRHNDAVLLVTNTGEGIPEEQLGKIFDRFYRTDKSRSRRLGGYGLGLSIARAIVEQHKGRIYAKSVLNDRTTFYAELPLA